jgi:hypothetical protein
MLCREASRRSSAGQTLLVEISRVWVISQVCR